MPVSLAQALPGLAALGAGAHRAADRRGSPRLPPGGAGAIRCADRRRRIQLDPDRHEHLEELAARRSKSFSQLVRDRVIASLPPSNGKRHGTVFWPLPARAEPGMKPSAFRRAMTRHDAPLSDASLVKMGAGLRLRPPPGGVKHPRDHDPASSLGVDHHMVPPHHRLAPPISLIDAWGIRASAALPPRFRLSALGCPGVVRDAFAGRSGTG